MRTATYEPEPLVLSAAFEQTTP